jgi:hypothetical protein
MTLPIPGTRAGWLAIGLAGGLLAAVIARPAIGPSPALAADPTTPEHTISVSGTGSVLVSPDLADLRIGVSITRPTVEEARATAATAMNGVLGALRKLGIADADLRTSMVSLQPVYDYSRDGSAPRITGYNLSNMVVATIRNLDRLSDAIDDSMAAGATTMDGITFRVADPAAAEARARRDAVAQARTRAQTLASAAGVSLGDVASISESSSGGSYPPVYYDGAAAKELSTPIQPGTNEVTVSASVVYTIR